MFNQSKDAFSKFAEASPFWAGALFACVDNQLTATQTRDVLVKCAGLEPSFMEEFNSIAASLGDAAHVQYEDIPAVDFTKDAGELFYDYKLHTKNDKPENYTHTPVDAAANELVNPRNWWEGVKNVLHLPSSLAKTVGPVAAGVVTEPSALVESGIRRWRGQEGPGFMGHLNQSVRDYITSGAEDLGGQLGFQGFVNPNELESAQTKVLIDKMHEAGYTPQEMATHLGIYDRALTVADVTGSMVIPGMMTGAFRGGIQGGVNSVSAHMPFLTGAERLFGGPISPARLSYLQNALNSRIPGAAFTRRNMVIPMGSQVPGYARGYGTLGGSLGVPQAAEGIKFLSKGLPVLGKPIGNFANTITQSTGKLPVLPLVVGAEIAEEGLRRGFSGAVNSLVDQPQVPDGNEYGDIAGMPIENRPYINNQEGEFFRTPPEIAAKMRAEGFSSEEAFTNGLTAYIHGPDMQLYVPDTHVPGGWSMVIRPVGSYLAGKDINPYKPKPWHPGSVAAAQDTVEHVIEPYIQEQATLQAYNQAAQDLKLAPDFTSSLFTQKEIEVHVEDLATQYAPQLRSSLIYNQSDFSKAENGLQFKRAQQAALLKAYESYNIPVAEMPTPPPTPEPVTDGVTTGPPTPAAQPKTAPTASTATPAASPAGGK